MLINRLRRDEQGAALVLVALTMVVLLGMTAFVVDIGRGQNERRSSVTAADGATLGGIQYIRSSHSVAQNEAMELARQSLPATYTDAEWAASWAPAAAPANGCPASAPAGYQFAPNTKCMMFNTAGSRMRVRIPNQIIETAFAGVLGVDELKTSAMAEAEIDIPGFGGVLPFGLPFKGPGGGEACLKDSSGGHAIPPCDGPDGGNFGYLDSPQYGNTGMGTSTRCTGSTNEVLRQNIIVGIDHILDEYTGPGPYVDPTPSATARYDQCFNSAPNTLNHETGSKSNHFDYGLVRADDELGHPARLRQGAWPKRSVTGVQLDDKPLWEFIPNTTIVGAPASCQRSAFTANPTKAQLLTCFTDYNATGTAPLFTADTVDPGDGVYDIQLSPRFAFVPEFHSTNVDSGSSHSYTVNRFRPIFIQTVFFGCKGGDKCNVIFNPGESLAGTGGEGDAESMSVMLFKDSMLPASILANGPGGSLGAYRASLIR
ncbi:MAG: TadE/TadG family type IV pilus assembly protein [Acidimicrobiia bacterium]